jgi:hypothetical protein
MTTHALQVLINDHHCMLTVQLSSSRSKKSELRACDVSICPASIALPQIQAEERLKQHNKRYLTMSDGLFLTG